MKVSTFPSLRVKKELREAAERVLREGESLDAGGLMPGSEIEFKFDNGRVWLVKVPTPTVD